MSTFVSVDYSNLINKNPNYKKNEKNDLLDDSNKKGVKCRKCNLFYGTKEQNYKCSNCFNNNKISLNYPWKYSKKFHNDLYNWCKNIFNNIPPEILKQFNKVIKLDKLKLVLKFIINTREQYPKFYISAKNGEKLLRSIGTESTKKSHIICSLVLDWWNMKKYNYNFSELCYYGGFGDENVFIEKIKSIPPPHPNSNFLDKIIKK